MVECVVSLVTELRGEYRCVLHRKHAYISYVSPIGVVFLGSFKLIWGLYVKLYLSPIRRCIAWRRQPAIAGVLN